MSYIELSLVKLLNFYGEDKMKFVLSDFVSNKNKDVEHFIHQKRYPFYQAKNSDDLSCLFRWIKPTVGRILHSCQ